MELLFILFLGLVLFGGPFLLIWLLVVFVLRAVARLRGNLNVATGAMLRESSWGSGSVNGVPARNTLKVATYEEGWMVRIAPIFGNGKLWLPKEGLEVSEINDGDAFRPRYRTITSGKNRVQLRGALADFVEPEQ